MLHEDRQFNIGKVEPREGQRGSSCSNKDVTRCPSLRYNTVNASEEKIDQAFNILFDALLQEGVSL